MPRLILFALVAVAPSAALADTKIDFNRDVRPILADNCFACHGPDDKARKAELKLHNREGALAVIDLNKPAESELLNRITTTDKADRMPPAKTGKTLTLLNPGGLVLVDGERMHAETRGLLLDPGETVIAEAGAMPQASKPSSSTTNAHFSGEPAVATAIALYGAGSGAALATVVLPQIADFRMPEL